ncbi:class I SAM-dependent methyltransferase [Roseicella aquatilis]|uniref:Class I SAM-dependent methyltransferase n=1 Tax=Roseicella aquatilis TaxID=2527868 RepID=A0A4R4D445_9PROT|nr:class I SAM-dependent methyltransferase [Roseicella aquatilis]TCZ52956.1 class I SAM-dependent methyltransferase [Roseicella aquatilis]
MSGNAAGQQAYWNSPATRAWATEHARIDARFAPLTEALMAAAGPGPGERVIDIGCGSGSTVLELARRVGAAGAVLGLDIAAASVAEAERRIAAAGLPQARVLLGDAATHPFPPGGADLLFSRFGVMFFEEPVPAFANLRRALAPGGRAALLAWRPPAENPWASAPLAAVRPLLPALPPPPGPEEPGQFAFGDAARVRRILEGAGFQAVTLTPCDRPMRLGADAAEIADFALAMGPIQRALLGATPAERAPVREALLAFFRERMSPEGVAMPAAAWLITARA